MPDDNRTATRPEETVTSLVAWVTENPESAAYEIERLRRQAKMLRRGMELLT